VKANLHGEDSRLSVRIAFSATEPHRIGSHANIDGCEPATKMNPYPPTASTSTQNHMYDSGSSMASSLSPQTSLPPPSALASAPPSRPNSGLQMAYLLHPPAQQGPTLPMPTSSPYAHSYDSGTGSPADRSSVLTDGNGSLPDAPSLAPHMGGASGQPQQKRAYRQRRKDPSCDACRERKVKVGFVLAVGLQHQLNYECAVRRF
jgi:hypothetical protein